MNLLSAFVDLFDSACLFVRNVGGMGIIWITQITRNLMCVYHLSPELLGMEPALSCPLYIAESIRGIHIPRLSIQTVQELEKRFIVNIEICKQFRPAYCFSQ